MRGPDETGGYNGEEGNDEQQYINLDQSLMNTSQRSKSVSHFAHDAQNNEYSDHKIKTQNSRNHRKGNGGNTKFLSFNPQNQEMFENQGIPH